MGRETKSDYSNLRENYEALFFTNEETSRSTGIWKRTDVRENLKRNMEDQGDCLDFEKAVSEQETVLLTLQSDK